LDTLECSFIRHVFVHLLVEEAFGAGHVTVKFFVQLFPAGGRGTPTTSSPATTPATTPATSTPAASETPAVAAAVSTEVIVAAATPPSTAASPASLSLVAGRSGRIERVQGTLAVPSVERGGAVRP